MKKTGLMIFLLAISSATAGALTVEEAEYRLVEKLSADGRHLEAAAEGFDFAARRPDSPFRFKALLIAGKSCTAAGKTDEAAKAYRLIYRSAPGEIERRQSHFALAEALAKQNQNGEAAALFSEFAQLYPSSPACPNALKLAVRSWSAAGDANSAAKAYRDLESRYPGSVQLAEAAKYLQQTQVVKLDRGGTASTAAFLYNASSRSAHAPSSAAYSSAHSYQASSSFSSVQSTPDRIPVRESELNSGRVTRNSLPGDRSFFGTDGGESRGGKLRGGKNNLPGDKTIVQEPTNPLRDRRDEDVKSSAAFSSSSLSSVPAASSVEASSSAPAVYREEKVIITLTNAITNSITYEVTNSVTNAVEFPVEVYVTNLVDLPQEIFLTNSVELPVFTTNYDTNWVLMTNSWEVTNIFYATNLLESVVSNLTYLTNTIIEKVLLTNVVSNQLVQTNFERVLVTNLVTREIYMTNIMRLTLSNRLTLTNRAFLTNNYSLTNIVKRFATNRVAVTNDIMLTQRVAVVDSNLLLIEEERKIAERKQQEMDRYQALLELRAKLLDLKQKAIDSKKDLVQQDLGGEK